MFAPHDVLLNLGKPAWEAVRVEALLDVGDTEPFPGRQVPNEEVGIPDLQGPKRVTIWLKHVHDPARFDVALQFIEHGMLVEVVYASGCIDGMCGIDRIRVDCEGVSGTVPGI